MGRARSTSPGLPVRLRRAPAEGRQERRGRSVGGKLHRFRYALGEYDGYNPWGAPDTASVAAVAIAISGDGALSKGLELAARRAPAGRYGKAVRGHQAWPVDMTEKPG